MEGSGAGFRLDVLEPEVGVGDVRLRRRLGRNDIVESIDHAVEQAMGWLEREACLVRRGSNNRNGKTAPFEQWGTRRLHAAGFIAAGFNHRT